jgi:hypothetical protein
VKKYLILITFFLISPSISFASGYLTPYGQGVIIQKYTMHGDGGMTLWVSGISNPDNCTDINLVHIKPTAPGYNGMISAAMAAYASGKKIGFWSNGCDVIPFWGGTATKPIVHTLWVTD